jgi:TonB family protein
MLLIYGFANGLGVHVFQPAPPVLIGHTLADPILPEPLPPTVLPRIGTTLGPINFPLDTPTFAPVVADMPIAISGTPITAIPTAGPARTSSPPPVTRVTGGPAAGFPNTADYYPSLSRQLGESGAVTVDVCVDAHGRLTGDPQIQDSSGVARLDAGALALARAGSGHYRSTTENGQPVSSCYPFKVRFSLAH